MPDNLGHETTSPGQAELNKEEKRQASAQGERKAKKSKHPLGELVQAVVIAFVLAFFIRTFLFQPFWVPSTSMLPTLQVDDRIIVNEVFLHYGQIERGDVMVFKYPLDKDLNYVKRIIGLPGETLEIKKEGVYIDGAPIDDDWVQGDFHYEPLGPLEIPQDAYFTLGDNRDFSADSRYWGFVPEENFVGKASLIYWPLGRMGRIE